MINLSKRFSRVVSWAFVVVALFLALAVAPAVQAQTTPSAAQLEAFKNLPADQQRAILQSMQKSGSGSSSRSGTAGSQVTVIEEQRETEEVEEPGAFTATGEPRLRVGDTVLIEIAIRAPSEYEFSQSLVEEKLSKLPPGQNLPSSPGNASTPTSPGDPALQAGAGTALVRELAVPTITAEKLERLTALRDRVRAGNPYVLDRLGTLYLPGVAGIRLAGLTEEQATMRLANDPAFRDYMLLRVTLLPLEREGPAALKPFGYDLFNKPPSTYAPVADALVPAEYVVGPGDTITVQLLGNTEAEHTLTVGRDGTVLFPNLGPIAVAGLRFPEARDTITSRVSQEMIGTRAVVRIGELRSISVLITGEVRKPGSFTVSALSTITNALFASGGIKEIGSLRDIQLKRRGRTVRVLDLYDLLLRGDSSRDVRLMSGDVIFVPPVGPTAGVTGEVRRPAIYELREGSKVSDLLYLAGGLMPDADPRSATIERVSASQARVVLDVDLTSPSGRGTALRSGDLLRVSPVLPQFTNAVTLKGNLYRPGPVAWRQGLRIADVIPNAGELKPGADLNYVLVRRESFDRQVSVISADLEQAWAAPNSESNVALQPRDQVYVFDLTGGRALEIRPVLEELRQQSTVTEPALTLQVGGKVRAPGLYPLETGMRVSDLLRAGAGLDEAAYTATAELTRYVVVNGERRQTAAIEVNLAAVLAGDPDADIVLQPFDYLVIKEVPQWSEQGTIVVGGEVRFPGTYPIQRGETLSSVLKRAGGLTDEAFAEGAVFTRQSLRVREAAQLAMLADRLQADLATLSLQATQSFGPASQQSAAQSLAIGQSLLENLRQVRPTGRLVIDLPGFEGNAAAAHLDVVVKDGDRLLVPGKMQEITVIGEVQSTTSHLWDPSLRRDDYIALSGGMTQNADDGRIYVVRASGSVVAGERSAWFKSGADGIRPGDTIVVPLDAQRMRPLPLWTAVTSIIYNLAISVAAVNSF